MNSDKKNEERILTPEEGKKRSDKERRDRIEWTNEWIKKKIEEKEQEGN